MRTVSSSAGEALQSAAEQGRICAIATAGHRDLATRATTYPELLPHRPFDPSVFAAVAMATAFAAPWCTPEQLRSANRATIWGYAAHWRIRHTGSDDDVIVLIDRCRAVAHGAPAGQHDDLGRFLAEIVAELTPSPAFAARRGLWWAELERMLTALHREWRWRAAQRAEPAGHRPSLHEYLDNAATIGTTFVDLTHWLRLGDGPAIAHLHELITVSREVQRVLRLVADLAAPPGRDSASGGLDTLLAADRITLQEQIGHLVDRCRELLRPLEVRCPHHASYLSRQLGFSSGFHRITDLWGGL
ncbi:MULTISPECIES: terpene synthase family protein [unclassified Solwaraspora]|uniref:terpene synthase family protein n=1 Tax=unclassified Solwaraspora TaxID=2627926 RepID=UPI00259B928D|nr:terpene synthase family protein [Solwaraspora sp. WMMA2056]WJK39541.1 terpene synthase family protein [Solwaraspora sp. WMMA2056]